MTKIKKTEKSIAFDDMINLPKNQLLKIQKWFNSAWKYGFTCIAIAQNYTDMPIQMRMNTMHFLLCRLNDVNTIKQILKNRNNNNGDDSQAVMEAHFNATEKPKNYFTLDLTPNSPARYRHNFTDIIHI